MIGVAVVGVVVTVWIGLSVWPFGEGDSSSSDSGPSTSTQREAEPDPDEPDTSEPTTTGTTEAPPTSATPTTTTTATAPPPQVVYLDEVDAVGESGPGFNGGGETTINGAVYSRAIWPTSCNVSEEYAISGEYARFESALGMNDESYSDWAGKVEFYADGGLIDSFDVTVGPTQEIGLTIAGVQRFRIVMIQVGYTACGSDGHPTLGDPHFIG